jgi:Tol biopolymer transport system component
LILAHLEQVLASEVFAPAHGQQRLLRFLVEKYAHGQREQLKEYTIGVEAFDRGDNFDPRLDPIVRVEASRLRKRLHRYYETAGRDSRVRINLPRGAYVPVIVTRDAPQPPPEIAAERCAPTGAWEPAARLSQRTPARSPYSWIMWAALASAVALAAAGAVLRLTRQEQAPVFRTFYPVTREPGCSEFPSISPDGSSVVYARRADAEQAHRDIWLRRLGREGASNLTAGSHFDNYQPAYSPNGQAIAFRSERAGGGIFLMDLADGKVRQLVQFGYHPAWSPDGKRIVFSTDTFSDPGESPAAHRSSKLFLADVATGSVRQFTSTETVLDAIQPAWSPHGHRIAFWGIDQTGNRNLWTVPAGGASPDGLKAMPVTRDVWTDWSPAWSPDGHYLYFASDRGGTMNLWRVRIDEVSGAVQAAPEAVTTPASYSGWITFSRDGRRFTYARRSISSKLFKVSFDPARGLSAGSPVPLTAGSRRIREPDMSPDGAMLVVRVQDPQDDIALIHPDGTQLRRLTDDAFSDRTPRWSPDGKQIVFRSNRSGRFELWSIRPDGTGLRQLTTGGAVHTAWQPDGKLVAYPRTGAPFVLDPSVRAIPGERVPSDFQPYAFSPDGRLMAGRIRAAEPVSLFVHWRETGDRWNLGEDAWPVWMRDSRRVLFSKDNEIWVADTRERRSWPAVSKISGDLHSRFTLSRDERTVFFASAEDEQDIWVAEQPGGARPGGGQ